MVFPENAWVGRRIRIGETVSLEVIAPTPRCAVPMLIHGHLPFSRDAVAVVNQLNQVEFPMLGPGTFPCLGAYATVLGTLRGAAPNLRNDAVFGTSRQVVTNLGSNTALFGSCTMSHCRLPRVRRWRFWAPTAMASRP